ncbi:hypothetical protein FIU97_01695 [Roseivivax sp. THAF40]|uniref:Ig-like domain-containing protein n=1 Tax=Roseivivax sp. THAF40 TaxID=2587858 RepID=UPI001268D738|nr:Ig-like domain-containing protein [Roseivivax sp. THAF40]QFT45276.1 hypothetical protein FIU97_01695 [Roseivivax sp. THAF40]
MQAIDVAVRAPAGDVQFSSLASNGDSFTLQAQPGQSISLNVSQASLRGYTREGSDLVISLADGQTIVIADYFEAAGARLFLSANGSLSEVMLTEAGDGVLLATYGPAETFGKWSPNDELIFLDSPVDVAEMGMVQDEETSMLATTLLGTTLAGGGGLGVAAGAAAVGAALLGEGDGDGNGGGGYVPLDPEIDGAGESGAVYGDDAQEITVTGIAEPGATVVVTIGDAEIETVAGEDASWSVVFTGDDFPADGNYTVTAVVTDPDGRVTDLSGPIYDIDVTAPPVEVQDGTITSGTLVNAEMQDGGITLTGSVEPGATVTVEIDGTTFDATVSEGTWTLDLDETVIGQGTYTQDITITATDAAGNATVLTDTIVVDTEISLTADTAAMGGDGTINASERDGGVTLSGTSEAGSVVEVTLGGVTQSATVAEDGTWSVVYSAADLPEGETTLDMTATATDAAGNVATTTGIVAIDTLVTNFTHTSTPGGADGVINAAEAAQGLTLTGTSEPGSTVEVTLGGVTQAANVGADGSWTVSYAAADLPTGEGTLEMIAVATDAAGNTDTISDTIAYDTLVTDFADTSVTGGIDGVINGNEATGGVTLTGTSEPGSTVDVTMGGTTETTTADANGNWSVTYPASAVPQGETTVPVTVTATDAAGNEATATGEVEIDTLVTNFTNTATPGGADGTINADEAAQGLVLTGTTEPGSTVDVSFAGTTVPAVVQPDGTWTASFPASAIPAGEGSYDIVATATDAAGNVDTLTQNVVVDTVAGQLQISAAPVEADDVVNAEEASDGVTLTGTSDPNQLVTVTLGGVSQDVITDANGVWNATFAPGQIAPGTYEAEITATITDAAGNTLVRTDSVQIDTEVQNFGVSTTPVAGDGVVNGAEAANGIALSGTTEPGSTVMVTLGGVTRPTSVDQNGNWTAGFAAGELAQGTYQAEATIVTVDPAGNRTQTTTSFLVDTEVDSLAFSAGPIAGDGVVNAAEAAAGLTLTGVVEPGSTLKVTLDGIEHDASVDAAGNWTVTIAEADLPTGELDAVTVTLDATDAAGNTRTESTELSFDTVVPDSPEVTDYTRNHTGLTGVSLESTDDAVYIGHVEQNGTVGDVGYSSFDIESRGETSYFFDETVPDGSHLVVTSADAAGNVAGTLHVVDDPLTNEVGMTDGLAQTLGAFEIETIDLQFAEDSQLTLTEAQVTALSQGSDTVTITGGVDDTVTITGAQAAGQTTQDGQTFNVFVLGDATVQIEDDITNVVI